MKQVIAADGVMPYEPFGFTNCVRYGDVLYLSGISGLGLDGNVVSPTIEGQTVQTFRNIALVLEAGGSGLEHILQMTSFVVDLAANGSGYVQARKQLLPPTYTSATIGVSALLPPGALVEVQCCAALAKDVVGEGSS